MAFAAPLVALAPTLLGVASAGVGALSAIQQGNYQSAVAKNNARLAEMNAARLSEASQIEAKRSDTDYRALVAEQIAQQGASGFDILGRSATRARETTLRTGRQQARDIRLEGESDARNRLQEAANFRAEGKQAKLQGYMSAAGHVLGAAGDAKTLVRGRRRRSFEGRRG